MSAQQTPRATVSRQVDVNGIHTHYLESGAPDQDRTLTLLVHGWPTSSYLWRNILPKLGTGHWTIALDLPGYGQSDKPRDIRFNHDFWTQYLEGFLAAVGARGVNLVVHDLGGPIGLIWAARHPDKLRHLVLLNTLVYSKLNWSAKLFVLMTFLPGISRWMTRPSTLRRILGLGTRKKLSQDVKAHYASTYHDPAARHCLLTTVQHLDPKANLEVERVLPTLTVPVTCIYGANDYVLPDISKTMARVARDLPQATVTALPDCGHFLQEDEPDKLGDLILKALNQHTPGNPAAEA